MMRKKEKPAAISEFFICFLRRVRYIPEGREPERSLDALPPHHFLKGSDYSFLSNIERLTLLSTVVGINIG